MIESRNATWSGARKHREGAAPWTALLSERLEQRSSVLDLGCGAEIPLTRMLAETFDVTGVDISSRQIETGPPQLPNAHFITADICSLDFPPQSFNAVVGSYSFIHVPCSEHEALLRKIARWLKARGLLLANFGIGNREVDYDEDWLGVPMFWSSFDLEGAHRR